MRRLRRQKKWVFKKLFLILGLCLLAGGATYWGLGFAAFDFPKNTEEQRLDFKLQKSPLRQWLGDTDLKEVNEWVDHGTYEPAVRQLDLILSQNPNHLGALVEKAQLARFDRRRPDLAVPLFETALAQTRDPWPIAMELVGLYEQTRWFQRGEEFFHFQSGHHGPGLRLLEAELKMREGDLSTTLALLGEGPALNPEDQAMRDILRGYAKTALGIHGEGLASFKTGADNLDHLMQQRIVAEKPVDHWVRWLDYHRLNLCEALMNQGQQSLAEPILTELAERHPHQGKVQQMMRILTGT